MKNTMKLILEEAKEILDKGYYREPFVNTDDTLDSLTKRIKETNIHNATYRDNIRIVGRKINALLADLNTKD